MKESYITINTDACYYNLSQIKKYVGKRIKILFVVKKNAYGHNFIPIVSKTEKLVDMLGVASVEEGIKLRKAGIKLPILILSYILDNEIKSLIKYNLTQTIAEFNLASKINQIAQNQKVKIHIKVDTGMGCLGILPENTVEFIKEIKKLKNIEIEGIFSHFPNADKKSFSLKQIQCFKNIILKLKKEKINISLIHMANSSAILNLKNSYFNMIRPGLIAYGIYPCENKVIKLKPVLSFKTKIVYIKEIPAGHSVSYDRTFIAKQKTKIGIIPIGYSDGLNRKLSNTGEVLVKGQRALIIGKIRMDQTMIDISKIEDIKVGEEVVIIGKQGQEQITVEQIAKKAEIIPYEVICGLSPQIPRIINSENYKCKIYQN